MKKYHNFYLKIIIFTAVKYCNITLACLRIVTSQGSPGGTQHVVSVVSSSLILHDTL